MTMKDCKKEKHEQKNEERLEKKVTWIKRDANPTLNRRSGAEPAGSP
jgi:hypothetical protein